MTPDTAVAPDAQRVGLVVRTGLLQYLDELLPHEATRVPIVDHDYRRAWFTLQLGADGQRHAYRVTVEKL
jgi:hypothetical protein